MPRLCQTRKLSIGLLLFVSALEGITPDTSDLSSHLILPVVFNVDQTDGSIDSDDLPDEVCGTNTARRSTVNQSVSESSGSRFDARYHGLAVLRPSSRLRSRTQRLVDLRIRGDRLHELCRLTC
jgi:hypothetical protein